MKFLADMGVNMRVVEWLRLQGHDVRHLRDEGLQRLPDSDIFNKAAGEKRTIITFDLDFGEIATFSKGNPASVIIFRLINTRTAFVIQRLTAVLPSAIPHLQTGTILTIEDARYRLRKLPIDQ
jgi:predicted nuclease of predicted toxin-antitoxin system